MGMGLGTDARRGAPENVIFQMFPFILRTVGRCLFAYKGKRIG